MFLQGKDIYLFLTYKIENADNDEDRERYQELLQIYLMNEDIELQVEDDDWYNYESLIED